MPEAAARAEVVFAGEPEGVHFEDHTADFALTVEAPSLAACLARAAAGLFSSFAEDLNASTTDREIAVELKASDLDELMVLWLDELLYRAGTERIQMLAFEVEPMDGPSLRARALGHSVNRDQTGEPPVKGVTRHQLFVREESGTWHAHVVIDV
jgi:SHS2 domain-containing protein